MSSPLFSIDEVINLICTCSLNDSNVNWYETYRDCSANFICLTNGANKAKMDVYCSTGTICFCEESDFGSPNRWFHSFSDLQQLRNLIIKPNNDKKTNLNNNFVDEVSALRDHVEILKRQLKVSEQLLEVAVRKQINQIEHEKEQPNRKDSNSHEEEDENPRTLPKEEEIRVEIERTRNHVIEQRKSQLRLLARGTECDYSIQYVDYLPIQIDKTLSISITSIGGYVMIYDDGSCSFEEIPEQVEEILWSEIQAKSKSKLNYAYLGPSREFYIEYCDGRRSSGNLPEGLSKVLQASSLSVKTVAISPQGGGFFISFFEDSVKGYWGGYLDDGFTKCCVNATVIESVWLGKNKAYFIAYYDVNGEYKISHRNIPKIPRLLAHFSKANRRIKQLIIIQNENTRFNDYSYDSNGFFVRYNDILDPTKEK